MALPEATDTAVMPIYYQNELLAGEAPLKPGQTRHIPLLGTILSIGGKKGKAKKKKLVKHSLVKGYYLKKN